MNTQNNFRLTLTLTLLTLSACASSPKPLVTAVEAPHWVVPPPPAHRPIPGDQALSDWGTCLQNSLQHCTTPEMTSEPATPNATR